MDGIFGSLNLAARALDEDLAQVRESMEPRAFSYRNAEPRAGEFSEGFDPNAPDPYAAMRGQCARPKVRS